MATRRNAGTGLILSYLYSGAIVQGSADAFKEATVATPITATSTDLCLVVREILVEFPAINPVSAGRYEVSITRKSQTAIPTLTATYQSLITKLQRTTGVTTSGGIIWDSLPLIQFTEEQAPRIVESNIYVQFDSNGTGAANTAYVRIGYTAQPISAEDRNTILVNTATAAA